MTDMSGQALTPLGAQLVKIQAGLGIECGRFRASFFNHLEDFSAASRKKSSCAFRGAKLPGVLFALVFDVKVSRWRVGNIRGEGLYGHVHAMPLNI